MLLLYGVVLDCYVLIIENFICVVMYIWLVDCLFVMLMVVWLLMLDVIIKVIFGVDDFEEVWCLGWLFEWLLNFGVLE